jgi:TRAP-type C4-dicarboxylate transport system permease small subunit
VSAGSLGGRRRVAGAAIAVLAATHWTLTKLRPLPPPRTAAVIQLSACLLLCLLLLQLLPGSVHAQEIVFSRHRNSQPSTTAKDRVSYSSLF